jgi:hypothetical protein
VVFQPRGMTAEELQAGYEWVYREFYTWPNILRRLPAGLTQKPRFLAFNVGLKKMTPLWELLIRLNALAPAFHAYHALDRALWQAGRHLRPRQQPAAVPLAAESQT